MSDKAYNVVVPSQVTTGKGENKTEKTIWTTVGSAFNNDDGSIGIEIRPNISVSGRLVLFKPDPKKEGAE